MYKKPEDFDAVLSLVGGGITKPFGGVIQYHDGQTPPTEEEINTELVRLLAVYDAEEYARNRQAAYASVGDQLDMLMKDMKNNTTTHREACEAVKAKYPKPS